jgi:hypothetical protein
MSSRHSDFRWEPLSWPPSVGGGPNVRVGDLPCLVVTMLTPVRVWPAQATLKRIPLLEALRDFLAVVLKRRIGHLFISVKDDGQDYRFCRFQGS